MNILFIHQNFPGQFRHLVMALQDIGHRCTALTAQSNRHRSSIPIFRYKFTETPFDKSQFQLAQVYAESSDRGLAIARAARQMRLRDDYIPDLIIGHGGWGETLFLKEVWPEAKLLTYGEFFFSGSGRDVGFDPEFSVGEFDRRLIAQSRNAVLAHALSQSDRVLCPTHWQASTHPPTLQNSIDVVFDGVDGERLAPNPNARFVLPNGKVIEHGDEVLCFINRNLEPYRGYHIFMRALPEIMAARPNAQVVIVGGEDRGYGVAPHSGSWKEIYLKEVKNRIDVTRLHFMGRIQHEQLIALYHIARVHAYLTYPFVLSWSCVESLMAGALVVGSKTPPVEEVITHGENGLLVNFFDVEAWSHQLIDCLANPEKYAHLRHAARTRALQNYDLKTVCLPQQIAVIERMLANAAPASPPGA